MLKSDMNTVKEENRCVARLEKVTSMVRANVTVKSGQTSVSETVNNNNDGVVDSKCGKSSNHVDSKNNNLASVEGTDDDDLNCQVTVSSSRPCLGRNRNKYNKDATDISEDIFDDSHETVTTASTRNTVTEATNTVNSIQTQIVEEALTVNNWEAGAIIGYRRTNINTITRETGTTISVEGGSSERLVKIKGKKASVERAIEMIKKYIIPPVLDSEQLVVDGGLNLPTRVVSVDLDGQTFLVQACLRAPHVVLRLAMTFSDREAGALIGKRGKNIYAISRETDVRISVPRAVEGIRERLVEITGKQASVERALVMIKNIIEYRSEIV